MPSNFEIFKLSKWLPGGRIRGACVGHTVFQYMTNSLVFKIGFELGNCITMTVVIIIELASSICGDQASRWLSARYLEIYLESNSLDDEVHP